VLAGAVATLLALVYAAREWTANRRADAEPGREQDRRRIGTRRQFREAAEWHKTQKAKRAAARAERRRAR
jgi:hypothetical protein